MWEAPGKGKNNTEHAGAGLLLSFFFPFAGGDLTHMGHKQSFPQLLGSALPFHHHQPIPSLAAPPAP